jgi:membrane-bound ClpP family serine protease
MIGEVGVVVSNLKPSGHIKIHNRRYQAVSQSGYVEAETEVEVIGGRGAYLIVREQLSKAKD